MDLRERENAVDPKRHWYYQSKLVPVLRAFREFADAAEQRIIVVDFGAGFGFFGTSLEAQFPDRIERVYLVDIGYGEAELGPVPGTKLEKVRTLPPTSGAVFVMMMDVLEHIEDDGAVLQSVVDSVPAGSRFFVTVPAFASLWSRHDEVLGHYRRYRLPGLRLLCGGAGLGLIRSGYLYGLIFPLVFLLRRLHWGARSAQSNMVPASPLANGLLGVLCRFEMRWAGFNHCAGVTAMFEGSKPHIYEPSA